MLSKRLFALIFMVSIITPAMAIEFAGTAWKGIAELGAVLTRGNTETQTLNGKLGVTNERDQWRHNVQLEALNISDKENTTAERYLLSGKSDFKFSENSYAFGALQYENDRFSGFDYRTTEAIGYGHKLINQKTLFLDVELGPGARQSAPKDGSDTINEFILRTAGKLEWKFSETATFSQTLVSDFGEESTITKTVTALAAQIVGNLAMKVSLTLKLNSDPPTNVQKDDAESALTLVYAF